MASLEWPLLEAKLDRILAAQEALRTVNRELSTENKELKRTNRALRIAMKTMKQGRDDAGLFQPKEQNGRRKISESA